MQETQINREKKKMEYSISQEKILKLTISAVDSHLDDMKQTERKMMLQDTTLDIASTQFEKLFKHLQVENLSKNAILYHLIYLAALETGFAEKSVYDQCKSELHFSCVITSFFDWHNVQCLSEQKPQFTCDNNDTKFNMQLRNVVSDQMLTDAGFDIETICMSMSATVTDDLMIVSLVPVHCNDVPQEQCERAVGLTISHYVVGTVNKQNGHIRECVRNMKDLVFHLREELFVPVRNFHFSLLELDSFPSLLGLPTEAYENIFHYLNIEQLGTLAKVNKLLKNIIVTSKEYAEIQSDKSPFSYYCRQDLQQLHC